MTLLKKYIKTQGLNKFVIFSNIIKCKTFEIHFENPHGCFDEHVKGQDLGSTVP